MNYKIILNLYFNKKIIFLFFFLSSIFLFFTFNKISKYSSTLSIKISNDKILDDYFSLLDISKDRLKYYPESYQKSFVLSNGLVKDISKNQVLKDMFNNKTNFIIYKKEILNKFHKNIKDVTYDYRSNKVDTMVREKGNLSLDLINLHSNLVLTFSHDNEIDILINDLKDFLHRKFEINNLEDLQEERIKFKNKNEQSIMKLLKLKTIVSQVHKMQSTIDFMNDVSIFSNLDTELSNTMLEVEQDFRIYLNKTFELVSLGLYLNSSSAYKDLTMLYKRINSKIRNLQRLNSFDEHDYIITNKNDFIMTIVSNKAYKLISNLEQLTKIFLNLIIIYLISFIIVNAFRKVN